VGAAGAGVGAPGPSGSPSADGVSATGANAAGGGGATTRRVNPPIELAEPERAAQIAAKGATEAARLAALAGDAARRASEGQTQGQPAGRADLLTAVADASKEAARSAADASRDASRAAEAAARAVNSSSPDAALIVRRETNRARDAAERAWEAVDEAKDRPALTSSLPVMLTSSPGMFQGFRRSMQAEASFARGNALLEERQYKEARDSFAEAVALYPEHDQARALLGWSEFFLGDFRGAVTACGRFVPFGAEQKP
jgi:tetratricopeptide (TPR) repeat protein